MGCRPSSISTCTGAHQPASVASQWPWHTPHRFADASAGAVCHSPDPSPSRRDGPTNAHGAGPASVGQIKKAEKMGIVPEGSAAKAEDGQLDAVMHRKISEMVHGGW
eukprot:COSAG04_NODE_64_length_29689_cov_158.096992_8_plen_107_part_00